MGDTNSLLHDITLLERKLHGMITQRERLGVNSKETAETEAELKRTLVDKKQKLRALMEEGESPSKQPPRKPALITNGVSLEMLPQIMEIEDRLCSVLPVIEIKAIDTTLLHTFTGPTMVSDVPDDGSPNRIFHPALNSNSSSNSNPNPNSNSNSNSLSEAHSNGNSNYNTSSTSPESTTTNTYKYTHTNATANTTNTNPTTDSPPKTPRTPSSSQSHQFHQSHHHHQSQSPRIAACSFSTYPSLPEVAGSGRVINRNRNTIHVNNL